jgi:hypothetical protein
VVFGDDRPSEDIATREDDSGSSGNPGGRLATLSA